MVEEMAALEKILPGSLYLFLKKKKTMGCRWVFSIKHKAYGRVETFKACDRRVACI